MSMSMDFTDENRIEINKVSVYISQIPIFSLRGFVFGSGLLEPFCLFLKLSLFIADSCAERRDWPNASL